MSIAEREPQLVATVTTLATCDGCEDPTDHQLHQMDDGALIFVCCACDTVTVLQERA